MISDKVQNDNLEKKRATTYLLTPLFINLVVITAYYLLGATFSGLLQYHTGCSRKVFPTRRVGKYPSGYWMNILLIVRVTKMEKWNLEQDE